jgi:hypothetical protein
MKFKILARDMIYIIERILKSKSYIVDIVSFIIFVALILFFDKIFFNGQIFHKGHDLYGVSSIWYNIPLSSLVIYRFSPNWYFGSYIYVFPMVTHLFEIKILTLLIKEYQLVIRITFLINLFISFISMDIFLGFLNICSLGRVIGSIFYALSPYFIVENLIEGHGDIGIGYSMQPLAFLFFEKFLEKPNFRTSIYLAATLTMIMLTHPQVFPILFLPFFILYVVFRIFLQYYFYKNITFGKLLRLSLIFLLSLLSGAYWWLPLFFKAKYFFSTNFSLEDTLPFTTGWLQIFTLRVPSCCVPSISQFFYSWIEIFKAVYVPLFSMGISILMLNKFDTKWKAVILSLLIPYIIAVLLAMGLRAQIKLFQIFFEYLPFFSSIRTPPRFVFFASYAIAVLVSVSLHEVIFEQKSIFKLFAILTLLILVLNPVKTVSFALQSFNLPQPLKEAYAALRALPYGRVFTIPLSSWVYSPQWRNVVNPLLWVFMFDKEVVSGGAPALATRFVGDYLNYLDLLTYFGKNQIDLTYFNYIYNVKYIFVDKSYPFATKFKFNGSLIFDNDNYSIYINNKTLGDVFLLISFQKNISVDNVEWREGTCPLTYKHLAANTIEVQYDFNSTSVDWMYFSINLPNDIVSSLSPLDELYVKYTIVGIPPEKINYGIVLVLENGDRYYIEYQTFLESSGYIRVPFFLLQPRYYSVSYYSLNKEAITKAKEIWIGIGENGFYSERKQFKIIFSDIKILKNYYLSVNYTKLSYNIYSVNLANSIKEINELLSKTRSSSYEVFLVLNYAYFPNWICELFLSHNIKKELTSERVLHFLNAFAIDVHHLSYLNYAYISYNISFLEKYLDIISLAIFGFILFASFLLFLYYIFIFFSRIKNIEY